MPRTLPAPRALLVVLVALVLGTPPARADLDGRSLRLQRPTAVRGAAMLYLDLASAADAVVQAGDWRYDTFAGVTVARQVLDRLALEGTVGGGGQGPRSGLHLGAAARVTVTSGERTTLTLALGGHSAFLKRYGPMYFGHLEAALELRTRYGLDVVVGGGPAVALNDSRQVPGTCFDDEPCQVQIKAGAVGPWINLQAGWAF